MATKTKSQKNKTEPANADTLKQEKEVDIEVKQLLKDERTHKIAGSVCLLFAILFFIAFTSYLFTWDEDQDKVFREGYRLLLGTDTKVANLMGTFGAFIAHFFIYKGFGIASYLICSLFFVVGVNLFFGKKVFSVVKNLKYLIIGLPLISVTASVIMNGNPFPWGGAVGDMIREWMYRSIGQIGAIGIIGVSFLAYVIWRFNPEFKLPSRLQKGQQAEADLTPVSLAKEEWPDEEDALDLSLKGNTMKGNAGVLNIPEQKNTALNHDLVIVEKDEAIVAKPTPVKIDKAPEEIPVEEKPEPVFVPQKTKPVAAEPSGLELEIKKVEEKPAEEMTPTEKVLQLKPYDPVLDLRDYKFPSLELLENHGSEKIVQDAAELENNKNQIINTLKNYDISIQRISATVGPTVTLYEIIPAAGVRI